MLLVGLMLLASTDMASPPSEDEVRVLSEEEVRNLGLSWRIQPPTEDGEPELLLSPFGQLEPKKSCGEPGFQALEFPEGASSGERTGLEHAARVALASLRFEPCTSRVSFTDGPWPTADVVVIARGSCWGLSVGLVAVDAADRPFLLAGDLSGQGETPFAAALADLNALADSQSIRIRSGRAAREYLESVLPMSSARVATLRNSLLAFSVCA